MNDKASRVAKKNLRVWLRAVIIVLIAGIAVLVAVLSRYSQAPTTLQVFKQLTGQFPIVERRTVCFESHQIRNLQEKFESAWPNH